MFDAPFNQGVISKAVKNGLIEINPINIRDFTTDKHRTTDDYQFGGGVGLVMKVEPIYNAVQYIKSKGESKIILLDPRGKRFDQSAAEKLSEYDDLTFICGRYEGIDERLRELVVDYEYSVGDYILTGGEPAAMVMIDAIARLVDNVVGDKRSLDDESFSRPRLEYPHYTRPESFLGLDVPKILLSGDHKLIEEWRENRSLELTASLRPDLMDIKTQDKSLRLDEAKRSFYPLPSKKKLSIALMHYPMCDKKKDVVATAVTNLDLHDISRSAYTFGVDNFFLITPILAQQRIVTRVIDHWLKGYGLTYNPDRSEAFSKTSIVSSLIDALKELKDRQERDGREVKQPIIVATTARSEIATISMRELSVLSKDDEVLLLFGTGWGFTDDILEFADFILEPIEGISNFNHLSVRSAVAIILSRIV